MIVALLGLILTVVGVCDWILLERVSGTLVSLAGLGFMLGSPLFGNRNSRYRREWALTKLVLAYAGWHVAATFSAEVFSFMFADFWLREYPGPGATFWRFMAGATVISQLGIAFVLRSEFRKDLEELDMRLTTPASLSSAPTDIGDAA